MEYEYDENEILEDEIDVPYEHKEAIGPNVDVYIHDDDVIIGVWDYRGGQVELLPSETDEIIKQLTDAKKYLVKLEDANN